MEPIVVIVGYLVFIAACIFARPAYIKMRERMSPKYAAARKVRLAQKSARDEAARKQARTNAKTRLDTWAAEHPDDETAQAYLATLPADVKSGGATANEDIESVLRRRQQQDDEAQERSRQRRLEEATYLQWALKNPANEVARRHLGTALVEANRNAQYGPDAAQARKTVAAIEAALGVTKTSHSWE